MKLADLVLRLQPLLADPRANRAAIADLLARTSHLAEAEVARHLVARALEPGLWEQAFHLDPLERRAAVALAGEVCSRPVGSAVLRHLVDDPDPRTRQLARSAIRRLGADDVVLGDQRQPHDPRLRVRSSRGVLLYRVDWPLVGPHVRRWGERKQQRLAPGVDRLGLPALPDVEAVAVLLGRSHPTELTRFLRPGSGRGAPYVDFEVPKARGGTRRISAPRAALRAIQRTILRALLDLIPAHPAAHGFVKGRSTVTNAAPHVGAAIVVKMDIREFFPTIHHGRVAGALRQYGYSREVARLLAGLTTRREVLADGRVAWPGRLPQGAPTSPALANLVCRRLDARLAGLAARVGATYTRYADDLTFSFRDEPAKGIGRFLWWVEQIVYQEGFAEHPLKRRVLRAGNQQRVTGVVVNTALSVPRAARRRFRAILHNCRTRGWRAEARGRPDFLAYLRGFAAYVHMVEPALGKRLLAEVREIARSDGHGPTAGGSPLPAPSDLDPPEA